MRVGQGFSPANCNFNPREILCSKIRKLGRAGLQPCQSGCTFYAALAAEVSMMHPERSTYFVTINSSDKRQILQSTRMAHLLSAVLLHYRNNGKFELHEYVIMPDHLHILLTPVRDITLEKVVQLIKGGFSFQAKRKLGFNGEVWQESYYDRRVRNESEYQAFRGYIHQNPVKRGLVSNAKEFTYSSANPSVGLDDVPQRLKPLQM